MTVHTACAWAGRLIAEGRHFILDDEHEASEDARKLTWAKVELRHAGKTWRYEHCVGYDDRPSLVEFMYFQGNYACDCNRSIFIGRYSQASFPEMECGDEIELVKLEVERR